jgi:hypothetical protein
LWFGLKRGIHMGANAGDVWQNLHQCPGGGLISSRVHEIRDLRLRAAGYFCGSVVAADAMVFAAGLGVVFCDGVVMSGAGG